MSGRNLSARQELGTSNRRVDVKQERINRRRLTWGVFIIVLGLWFLVERLNLIDHPAWREMWPAVMIVLGLAWIAVPDKPRRIASGVSFVLIGFWFFACIQHWYGLTYRTAWPLLVMVAGLEIVLKAVIDRFGPAREEEHHA